MIEHQVNNYAGYRNIEPKRQRPTCNPPVPDEISTRGPVKSNQYQGHDNNGEDRMGYQNRKVQRTHQTLPRKLRGAMIEVVSKIRDQEES